MRRNSINKLRAVRLPNTIPVLVMSPNKDPDAPRNELTLEYQATLAANVKVAAMTYAVYSGDRDHPMRMLAQVFALENVK